MLDFGTVSSFYFVSYARKYELGRNGKRKKLIVPRLVVSAD